MFKYLYKKFKCMIKIGLSLEFESKFILTAFFLLFIPIALSTAGLNISPDGNMVTIRTMFSSIFGYLIENTSRPQPNTKSKSSLPDGTCSNPNKYELRILIVGHLLLAIIIILIIGIMTNTDQHNHSTILLKNTGFSCIGFLVSGLKNNRPSSKS